ncbi:MAG: MarR family transcriptional regulator [Pedosphaera sp.]|nr:MarR family transcriptional regulator [Pedosphaera sp.]
MSIPTTSQVLDSEEIDSPGRRRLPPVLRRACYSLNQAFRRRIAHTEVTPDQFTVMRTLQECDPNGVTQRELTQLMSSDPNTVASLLERMERAGWIERRIHEKDKRAHRIRLLAAGRSRYREARKIAVELQTEVLAALPVNEREKFLEQLTSLADSCREAALASPKGRAKR